VGINTFAHIDGVAAMYFASTLTFVSKFLEDSGVQFSQSNTPCSYGTIGPVGIQMPIWLIVILILLALSILALALKKPKVIKERVLESYTQWQRRVDKNFKAPNSIPIIKLKHSQSSWRIVSVIDKKTVYEFKSLEDQGSWVIGRDPNASDICIRDNTISRAHLILTYHNGYFSVEDMNTTNGTCVNNDKISPFKPIKVDHKTIIRVGKVELILLKADK
jgi:hypothetical protein